MKQIIEASVPIISLFAIFSGIAYHTSIPAGLGVCGALVWLDISIHAFRRGRDADR